MGASAEYSAEADCAGLESYGSWESEVCVIVLLCKHFGSRQKTLLSKKVIWSSPLSLDCCGRDLITLVVVSETQNGLQTRWSPNGGFNYVFLSIAFFSLFGSIPFTLRLPGNAENPSFTQDVYGGFVTRGGEVVLPDALSASGGDPCLPGRVEYAVAEQNTQGEKKKTLEVMQIGGENLRLVFQRRPSSSRWIRQPARSPSPEKTSSKTYRRAEKSACLSGYDKTFPLFLVGHVGMGGKGPVTPLLKGKVRIPPPAGHFIHVRS